MQFSQIISGVSESVSRPCFIYSSYKQ